MEPLNPFEEGAGETSNCGTSALVGALLGIATTIGIGALVVVHKRREASNNAQRQARYDADDSNWRFPDHLRLRSSDKSDYVEAVHKLRNLPKLPDTRHRPGRDLEIHVPDGRGGFNSYPARMEGVVRKQIPPTLQSAQPKTLTNWPPKKASK